MNSDTARTPLRSRVKEGLLASLYYTGILWLLVRIKLRNRAFVLTYHRVLPNERIQQSFSAPSIVITPDTFEWQMKFVRQHFRPVSAEEFSRLLRLGRSMPARTCLVTFDDGWWDNLEFALPALTRHNVPAVLFVATDYVGSGACFWQERLARLLFGLRESIDIADVFDDLGFSAIRQLAPQEAKVAIRNMVEQLKHRPWNQVELLLSRLMRIRPSDPATGEDRFLTWDEVRLISKSGLVTIGSHAASHKPLTQIPLAAVEEELRRSAVTIRAEVSKDVTMLAYPNGNADESIGAKAKQSGYSAAFTTKRGLVSGTCDPHLLPRINMHEAATRSRAAFLGRITGLM